MPDSPGFRQIKQLKLEYDKDMQVILPKTLSVLGVGVIPDAQDKNNVPILTYLWEGQETELKTLRLISGQAELDLKHESLRCLGGPIPVLKRHHPNCAHLFLVSKKKSHPDNNPKPAPKKRTATLPDPECVKAKENAERVAQEKAEFEARLEESGV